MQIVDVNLARSHHAAAARGWRRWLLMMVLQCDVVDPLGHNHLIEFIAESFLFLFFSFRAPMRWILRFIK